MKMWAVFDKDGALSGEVYTAEREAWRHFLHSKANIIGQIFHRDVWITQGYTCQPVVVMREEVYNDMASTLKNTCIDNNKIDSFKQFLKAGE